MADSSPCMQKCIADIKWGIEHLNYAKSEKDRCENHYNNLMREATELREWYVTAMNMVPFLPNTTNSAKVQIMLILTRLFTRRYSKTFSALKFYQRLYFSWIDAVDASTATLKSIEERCLECN